MHAGHIKCVAKELAHVAHEYIECTLKFHALRITHTTFNHFHIYDNFWQATTFKKKLPNLQVINFVMVFMFSFQKFYNIIDVISVHSF